MDSLAADAGRPLQPPFEAYIGTEPYLFASYAHKDSPAVYPEVERLHRAGYRIWYDEGIETGKEWPEDIARALHGCAVFLVFVSPRAVASVNVRNEINFAVTHGKPFIAVYFEETALPAGLELQIGVLQGLLKYEMQEAWYQHRLAKALPASLIDPGRKVEPEVRSARDDAHGTAESRAQPSTLPPAVVSASTIETHSSSPPVVSPAADTRAVRSAAVLASAPEPAAPAIAPYPVPLRPSHTFKRLGLPALALLVIVIIVLSRVHPGGKTVLQAPGQTAGGAQIQTKTNPKDGADMVLIPTGDFLMGDEDVSDNPRRNVYLDGYYLYKNLVTVAQYRKFCDATGHTMPVPPSWGWKDDHPIVNVTWSDARSYCDWAGVSLPTEAQWEKAARGTGGRKYPWENAFDASRLWCSSPARRFSTAPVGSFPSGVSPEGALDMAGNVWQWCADWYDADYYQTAPERNPVGAASSPEGRRVLRGGSWLDTNPDFFRCAYRYRDAPDGRNDNYGFRCVLEP